MENSKFQHFMGKDNQFYFRLRAANGEPIGKSEMYATSASRENGIEAVKKVAPDAPIEDTT